MNYQQTDTFIPRTISICQGFSQIKHSFHVLSAYTEFQSAYYSYALNFIWHISISKISFRVFGNCAKRNSDIRNDFFFLAAFKRDTTSKNRVRLNFGSKTKQEHLLIRYCSSKGEKKFIFVYSDDTRNDFEFEYLGKFEFTFENILGYKTESKGSEKTRGWKSRPCVPLSG